MLAVIKYNDNHAFMLRLLINDWLQLCDDYISIMIND